MAFIEELPGANTQGDTLEQARENLHEAVALVLAANRFLTEQSLEGAAVVRETFVVPGHLERCGCEFLREGNSHTVYVNRAAGKLHRCRATAR